MNKVLVICGPTATGKTELAARLAKEFNGELISADSRQVYRGRDLETNKDVHLLGPDLTYREEQDIDLMKKVRSYKGLRHGKGLTVRGQKTRSNFRKNKGKVMGVRRASVAPPKKENKE